MPPEKSLWEKPCRPSIVVRSQAFGRRSVHLSQLRNTNARQHCRDEEGLVGNDKRKCKRDER